MSELRRLASTHLDAVLGFELENRAYFSRFLTDRGDKFYESLADHHRALLDEQEAGFSAFFVLVDPAGSIIGRFNLYDIHDRTARVGYRVAERAAGRGAATRALLDLCRRAIHDHQLDTLTAETSATNLASQRVLEKAGFVATGACIVAGKPGRSFTIGLTEAGT